MREILFRAKHFDNEEWIYGMPSRQSDGAIREIEHLNYDRLTNGVPSIEYTEIKEETVCQYTGLTDKNGKEIFEGDILRFDDYSNYPVFWDSDYCAFGSCLYSDFDHLSKYRNTKIEVVGNIFDNSELLEEDE